MANIKISQLKDRSTVTGEEVLPLSVKTNPNDTSYESYKVSIEQISEYVGHAGDIKPETLGIGIGVCSTASSSDSKAVTLNDFVIKKNGLVAVQFYHAVTGPCTLNINGTGAIAAYYSGEPITDGLIADGDTVIFSYDGDHYVCVSGTYPENMLMSGYVDGSAVMPDFDAYADTVHVTEQSLNATQQAQARLNIGLDNTSKFGFGIGECTDAAAQTAKTVAINGFTLMENGLVTVTFVNDVPANATLNVNGTGAKPIIVSGSAITAGIITGGTTVTFAYDGSNYVMVSAGAITSLNKFGTGLAVNSSAATGTAMTAAMADYHLTVNGIVAVKFAYGVPASATLNINNCGDVALKLNGTSINAGLINAGDIVTVVYDGTAYEIVNIESQPTYTKIGSTGLYTMTI